MKKRDSSDHVSEHGVYRPRSLFINSDLALLPVLAPGPAAFEAKHAHGMSYWSNTPA